ncbi:Glycosyltransferase Family 4 [Syntrophus gentianae]|uniref:Glycosyltransferase Family 4 n=1 Tax=Syntrophus gentianae TaxID=43775 RepID=A0A1H7X2K4_9BACT|nr:glycosyltransferase family 4 protein [Syntrophus gentianae]SEM27794.1 Glycosyltransferase Family 4 [Syntrophus gentianae]
MKILFLNNYFYIRGGSERVFFGEMDLMRNHGHEIAEFARRHSLDMPSKYSHFFPQDIVTDKISISWDAVRTVKEIFYSVSARDGLDKLISQFKPAIAHVHNMYGRLTTSVLDVLSQRRIPTLMTLHDYKVVCPSYRFMFENHICEDCKGARYYMAVKNHCHKNSFAASAMVAMESYFNEWFNRYKKNVRYFISPSRFLENKLIEFGWPERQIKFVPNFLDLSEFDPNYSAGDYLLYLGRLSEEKGVATLIKAFTQLKNDKPELVIVGDGPMRKELEEITRNHSRIRFAGYLSGSALREVTQNALAVVVPSVCYENAPISILEALAYGKPVIGANIGGIPEMIQNGVNGYLFESGNCNDLKNALEYMINLPAAEIEKMGMDARRIVERENSSESHYLKLMDIYQEIQA